MTITRSAWKHGEIDPPQPYPHATVLYRPVARINRRIGAWGVLVALMLLGTLYGAGWLDGVIYRQ